jgi:hypothetical protein
MASTLRVPAVIPPGESPFHVKGLVYQGLAEFFDASVPGGTPAVHAYAGREDESGSLGRFLATSFVAGSWFDALPVEPLTEAAARVRGTTHAKLVREAAAFLARRDLRGVYKFALAGATPDVLAMRLPGLTMRYFDFGAADAERVGEQTILCVRSGVPESLARWFVWVMEGYVPTALTLAGAVDVRVNANEPRRETSTSTSAAIVRLEFRIAWT